MKKQAIIPLFIPHLGCPHDCVFCNQNTITASNNPVGPEEVREIMDSRLKDLEPLALESLEAAFYGGSFTALPPQDQRDLLAVVSPYKIAGRIQKIRLSTRPDYINDSILELLRHYGVDIIELGAQSFDEEVLQLSARGHTVQQTKEACQLLRRNQFSLGIQLMIGLPGDSKEKSLLSAKAAVALEPDFVRIYPTIVLAGSKLADMYLEGAYSPFSISETVNIAKDMVRIFQEAKIPVIRIGLKSTDNISKDADLSGQYHPAFRQLVEGSLALEDVLQQLGNMQIQSGAIILSANPKSFSNIVGHKATNKIRLQELYPHVRFQFRPDSSIPIGHYLAIQNSQSV
jgi:histone acetyltransferase (RNA polymerase elongator complex component)